MKALKKFMAVVLAGVMSMAMLTACTMDDMTGKESSDLMQNSVLGAGKAVLTADNLECTEVGTDGTYTYAKKDGKIYIKVDKEVYELDLSNKTAKDVTSGAYSNLVNIDSVINVKDKISTAAHPDDKTFIIGSATYKFDEKSNLTYLMAYGTEYKNVKATSDVPSIGTETKDKKVTKITFNRVECTVE